MHTYTYRKRDNRNAFIVVTAKASSIEEVLVVVVQFNAQFKEMHNDRQTYVVFFGFHQQQILRHRRNKLIANTQYYAGDVRVALNAIRKGAAFYTSLALGWYMLHPFSPSFLLCRLLLFHNGLSARTSRPYMNQCRVIIILIALQRGLRFIVCKIGVTHRYYYRKKLLTFSRGTATRRNEPRKHTFRAQKLDLLLAVIYIYIYIYIKHSVITVVDGIFPLTIHIIRETRTAKETHSDDDVTEIRFNICARKKLCFSIDLFSSLRRFRAHIHRNYPYTKPPHSLSRHTYIHTYFASSCSRMAFYHHSAFGVRPPSEAEDVEDGLSSPLRQLDAPFQLEQPAPAYGRDFPLPCPVEPSSPLPPPGDGFGTSGDDGPLRLPRRISPRANSDLPQLHRLTFEPSGGFASDGNFHTATGRGSPPLLHRPSTRGSIASGVGLTCARSPVEPKPNGVMRHRFIPGHRPAHMRSDSGENPDAIARSTSLSMGINGQVNLHASPNSDQTAGAVSGGSSTRPSSTQRRSTTTNTALCSTSDGTCAPPRRPSSSTTTWSRRHTQRGGTSPPMNSVTLSSKAPRPSNSHTKTMFMPSTGAAGPHNPNESGILFMAGEGLHSFEGVSPTSSRPTSRQNATLGGASSTSLEVVGERLGTGHGANSSSSTLRVPSSRGPQGVGQRAVRLGEGDRGPTDPFSPKSSYLTASAAVLQPRPLSGKKVLKPKPPPAIPCSPQPRRGPQHPNDPPPLPGSRRTLKRRKAGKKGSHAKSKDGIVAHEHGAVLLKRTFMGVTKVLYEDGNVEEIRWDQVDPKVAGLAQRTREEEQRATLAFSGMMDEEEEEEEEEGGKVPQREESSPVMRPRDESAPPPPGWGDAPFISPPVLSLRRYEEDVDADNEDLKQFSGDARRGCATALASQTYVQPPSSEPVTPATTFTGRRQPKPAAMNSSSTSMPHLAALGTTIDSSSSELRDVTRVSERPLFNPLLAAVGNITDMSSRIGMSILKSSTTLYEGTAGGTHQSAMNVAAADEVEGSLNKLVHADSTYLEQHKPSAEDAPSGGTGGAMTGTGSMGTNATNRMKSTTFVLEEDNEVGSPGTGVSPHAFAKVVRSKAPASMEENDGSDSSKSEGHLGDPSTFLTDGVGGEAKEPAIPRLRLDWEEELEELRHPLMAKAHSLLTIPLPEISAEGEMKVEDIHLCGVPVHELFRRLFDRETGAMRSQLSGLDVTRFMRYSLPANEMVAMFFWFIVVHCRRVYMERLLIGRFQRLTTLYQELFPRGNKEAIPDISRLRQLVVELHHASRRWNRKTRRAAGSSSSSVVREEELSPQYTLELNAHLQKGNYATILATPGVYRGGTLPSIETIEMVSHALSLLASALMEHEDLVHYEELCFHRLAILFGTIFTEVTSEEKDVILQSYGFIVVRLTNYSLHYTFPNDVAAGLFHADFRADMYRVFQFWCSGLQVTHVAVKGWPLPLPEDFSTGNEADEDKLRELMEVYEKGYQRGIGAPCPEEKEEEENEEKERSTALNLSAFHFGSQPNYAYEPEPEPEPVPQGGGAAVVEENAPLSEADGDVDKPMLYFTGVRRSSADVMSTSASSRPGVGELAGSTRSFVGAGCRRVSVMNFSRSHSIRFEAGGIPNLVPPRLRRSSSQVMAIDDLREEMLSTNYAPPMSIRQGSGRQQRRTASRKPGSMTTTASRDWSKDLHGEEEEMRSRSKSAGKQGEAARPGNHKGAMESCEREDPASRPTTGATGVDLIPLQSANVGSDNDWEALSPDAEAAAAWKTSSRKAKTQSKVRQAIEKQRQKMAKQPFSGAFAEENARREKPLADNTFETIDVVCANSEYRLLSCYHKYVRHAQGLQKLGEQRINKGYKRQLEEFRKKLRKLQLAQRSAGRGFASSTITAGGGGTSNALCSTAVSAAAIPPGVGQPPFPAPAEREGKKTVTPNISDEPPWSSQEPIGTFPHPDSGGAPLLPLLSKNLVSPFAKNAIGAQSRMWRPGATPTTIQEPGVLPHLAVTDTSPFPMPMPMPRPPPGQRPADGRPQLPYIHPVSDEDDGPPLGGGGGLHDNNNNMYNPNQKSFFSTFTTGNSVGADVPSFWFGEENGESNISMGGLPLLPVPSGPYVTQLRPARNSLSLGTTTAPPALNATAAAGSRGAAATVAPKGRPSLQPPPQPRTNTLTPSPGGGLPPTAPIPAPAPIPEVFSPGPLPSSLAQGGESGTSVHPDIFSPTSCTSQSPKYGPPVSPTMSTPTGSNAPFGLSTFPKSVGGGAATAEPSPATRGGGAGWAPTQDGNGASLTRLFLARLHRQMQGRRVEKIRDHYKTPAEVTIPSRSLVSMAKQAADKVRQQQPDAAPGQDLDPFPVSKLLQGGAHDASLISAQPLANIQDEDCSEFFRRINPVHRARIPLPEEAVNAVHRAPRPNALDDPIAARPQSANSVPETQIAKKRRFFRRQLLPSSSPFMTYYSATVLNLQVGQPAVSTSASLHNSFAMTTASSEMTSFHFKDSLVTRPVSSLPAKPHMAPHSPHPPTENDVAAHSNGSTFPAAVVQRHGGMASASMSMTNPIGVGVSPPVSSRWPLSQTGPVSSVKPKFKGVGRAVVNKTHLLVVPREDGLHRPMLYRPLCRAAGQQLNAVMKDMKKISKRENVSRQQYTGDHISVLSAIHRLESETAEARFKRRARANIELAMHRRAAAEAQQQRRPIVGANTGVSGSLPPNAIRNAAGVILMTSGGPSSTGQSSRNSSLHSRSSHNGRERFYQRSSGWNTPPTPTRCDTSSGTRQSPLGSFTQMNFGKSSTIRRVSVIKQSIESIYKYIYIYLGEVMVMPPQCFYPSATPKRESYLDSTTLGHL
eukprot:gene11369-7875_t